MATLVAGRRPSLEEWGVVGGPTARGLREVLANLLEAG
jgi:hypothetical protein